MNNNLYRFPLQNIFYTTFDGFYFHSIVLPTVMFLKISLYRQKKNTSCWGCIIDQQKFTMI